MHINVVLACKYIGEPKKIYALNFQGQHHIHKIGQIQFQLEIYHNSENWLIINIRLPLLLYILYIAFKIKQKTMSTYPEVLYRPILCLLVYLMELPFLCLMELPFLYLMELPFLVPCLWRCYNEWYTTSNIVYHTYVTWNTI